MPQMDARKPPDPAARMAEHLKKATDRADLPSDGHISGVDDLKADPASTNTQQLPQTQTGPQGPYQQGFTGHPYSGQPGQGPCQGPPQDSGQHPSGQHPSVEGHGQTGQQVPSYPYPGQQGQWPGQGQPNYPHPQQGGQIPYPQTPYYDRFGVYPQPGAEFDPTSTGTSQADFPARRDISPGHPPGLPDYPGQQVGHFYSAYSGCPQYPSEPPPSYDGHQEIVLKLEQEITPCYKIEVKGLPASLSNDSISLYFENRRRSGGGPVVNVINREDGTAVVEFARPDAVERVLKETHTISGTCIQVSRFTPVMLQSEVSTTCDTAALTPDTVRVSGCAGISDHVLEMYFERREKSGGGEVKYVKRREENVALVTFKDPGDAKRVLEKGSHKIQGMDVKVTLYKPKPPTPPPEEEVPLVLPDTIIVIGCRGILDDVLEMYFESKKKSGGGDVKSMERREEDVVLVTFEDPEYVKRVLEKGSHKIQGMDVEVTLYKPRPPTPPPVVSPDTIIVTGCGGISDVFLEMYFESRKKSGGGDVKSMERTEEDVVLVTFEDPEDVKRVLEKGSHKIERKDVDVSRYKPRPPTPPPVVSPDTIVVTGCKDMSDEFLEMYFESEKKSGGGDVKSIERIDEDVVLVTFEDPDDVEAVLQRSHQIQGDSLQVSQYTPPSRSARHRKLAATEELYLSAEEDEDEEEEEDDNSVFVILVQGLANTVTNEILTDFFENRRRNGGGEVDIVEIDRDSATALVYFVEGDVVRRVLKKAPLVLENKTIEVSEYLPSKQPGLVTMDTVLKGKKEGTVVKVEKYGLTSDDVLTMYFENTKRSGGAAVNEVIGDDQEHAKYVVFGSKEEAEAVVAKQDHIVDGHKLLVSLYRHPTPPPPRPQYHDRFFITGLREKTTEKTLMKFLKHKLACHPKDLVYGEEPGSVLVNIEVTQGSRKLKKMQRVCRKHPLEGAFLELSAVPVSNCIQVTGIMARTSTHRLAIYFESKRAGNAKELPVEKVNIIKDPRHAIVHFEDHSVIPEILYTTHKLDDMALTVSLYTECLGSGGGHINPTWFTLPPPITLQNVDYYKLQFIRDSRLNMKNLQQQLQDGHTDLKLESDGSVILECCLTKDMLDARNKAKSWKKNATEDLEHFLSLLITEKVNVLQEVWDHVMKEVEKMKNSKPDAARLYVFDQSQLIVVVGHKMVAEGLSKQVKDVVASVEGDHERRKKEINETVSGLKSWQLQLLLALGFPGDMMKKYEHLKVEINVTKKEIFFIGLVSFVKSAKVDMYETMTDFKQTSLPNVLDAQMMLLQKPDVRSYIVKKLKLRHLVGVWEADKGKLYVYGRTDTEAADVVRVLKQCVVQQVINLDPESVPLLASPDWKRICDDQTQGRGDTVKIITAVDQSHIVIAAIDELVAGVAEEVNNFITEYTVYSDTVQFPRGIQRFMTMHKDTEIRELSEKFKIYSVKIIYQRTSGDFTVKGTKDGLRIVMGELERLSQNVIYGSHLFNKPGIAKLILSDKGEADIKRIEQTECCVIERTYDPNERTVYGNTRKQRGLRTVTGGPQTQATCDLGAGRTLYMCQGDITQMKVGAIVNAANQQLSHGGGLARAIVDKGGRIIQDESDAIRRKNGDVNVGKVAVTSSGNLPCQKVIHAVGPIWSGGKNDEEGLLQEAIFNSLEMADSWKLPSIAIPALSTGIYGYPVTEATESIIDAVQIFFTDNPGSKVMDVYVCDNNVQAFIQAVKKVCGAAKVVSVNQGVVAADEDDGQHRSQGRSRRPRHSKQQYASPESDDAFSRQREDVFSSSSIQINIVSGEIATEQVDVIVNSTSHVLDLNYGVVSKSILQRAGMVIQNECSQKYPSGIRPGCFAISSGGMLNCRQIYHTCLPSWTQGTNGQQVLQELIRDCLQEAHSKRYQSIAFPALGTGNLGYPRDVVAKTMMETVEQFGQDNPGSSLQEVKIVVYHKDTAATKAFQYHRQIGSNGAGAHSGAHGKATSSSHSRRTFAKEGSSSAEAKTDFYTGVSGGSRHEAGSSGSTPGTVDSAPSDVTLHFFYDDAMHLDRAIQKLENTYRESVADQVFQDTGLKDLSKAQERELDDLKNKYQIDLDSNRKLGQVRLEGLSGDIVSAVGALHKLTLGVQCQKQETEKPEIVSSFVQWKHVETDQNGSDVHRDYDKISNQTIEEAYKSKKPSVTLRTTDNMDYVIDFKNMEKYPLNNTSDKAAIIRKDMIQGSSSIFEPPPNWTATSSDCENVVVDMDSSEYQTLVHSFWKSVGSPRAIIKLERIQTKFLWQQYLAKKQQLDMQNPPGHQNERILWHGTAPDAIPSICKGGFNRSYCGKNATAHGDGVYFAVNAKYSSSSTYSVPDHQGYKYMFQARVLTGVTTPGQRGMRVPPIRDPANHINFDAVTGPSMFIIFNDTQAYPEYLITFQ
ncbi:protein mono-ADP-ribosyltransferase PARP14-like isoform X2 [Haliotis rufescens]|uniref:protein mono-ADP-ribosyltransferase PARP14-like isoform X2 n=1 Tax=Haliotis rufescens TaxID=6454 RepID=UPI00201F34C1|nr:protein mono-ADP-ribosyltransferase PARP14-like isoform X2 [Haliotis rufescens]